MHIYMIYDRESSLIQNHVLFTEDYIPPILLAREDQIKELEFCISPAVGNKKPINAWIYGGPGTGKTATCKFLLRKLEKETNVRGLYINCWKHPTFYAIIDKMVRELRILGAEKLDTSFKLERLQNHLKGKPFILFLDEIDHLSNKERDSILYNFCNMENIGIIAICNSKHILYNLDERIKSRLDARRIEFKPYSVDELLEILAQRANMALVSGSYTRRILKQIAELSEQDARTAIQTLKNAAYLADQEISPRITSVHVQKGHNSAKSIKKHYLLNKLTEHHRLLYEIIKENQEILSGQLWRAYLKRCKALKLKPIAQRTYSEYLRKLIASEIIIAKRALVKGKVRKFRIAE